MAISRTLIVPLLAALSAALFAHVAIDVVGDYVLAHDAYDDVAHGSRTIVFGVVAAAIAMLASLAFRAAVLEARGSVDAFAKSVRSYLDLGSPATLAATFGLGTLVLAAMESADVRMAGGSIDDVGDLFGGSLVLGFAAIAVCAVCSTFATRAIARGVAGAGRALVRALVAAFAARGAYAAFARCPYARASRPLAPTRTFGTRLSGRAPPPRSRPTIFTH